MASKKIYKHHERTSLSSATADAQAREIVLDSGMRQSAVKFSDLYTGVLNVFIDVDGFGGLANAISAAGSNEATFCIRSAQTLAANLTVPSNISLMTCKGGSIAGAYTLTISGHYTGFFGRHFASELSVVFGADNGVAIVGRTQKAFPQWWGAVGDGIVDDSDALRAALSAAHNLYTGIEIDFSTGQYNFTKTLCVRKPITGFGWRLLPSGNGTNFKVGASPSNPTNYSLTTATTGIDCCVVLQDGGSLQGGAIQVTDSNLDVSGNSTISILNLESCFGKMPVSNMEIIGLSSARNLIGVTVRESNACTISGLKILYTKTGLVNTNSSINTYFAITVEQMGRGGNAYYFDSSVDNSIFGCWAEGVANNTIPFYFTSCNGFKMHGLKVGEALGGSTQSGTADATANTITQDSDYQQITGDRIRIRTGGLGLSTTANLYVVNANSSNFQVSSTAGGSAIDITSSGAVSWYSLIQNYVRFVSCDRMTGSGLYKDSGVETVSGTTTATGSYDRINVDDTFEFYQNGIYGKYTEYNYKPYNRIPVPNIALNSTTPRFVERINGQTQLRFKIVAQTAGLSGTDGGLNIYKNTSGVGLQLKGTVTPTAGALTTIGAAVTLTYDLDETISLYISPITPSGVGTVDVVTEWLPTSGLS